MELKTIVISGVISFLVCRIYMGYFWKELDNMFSNLLKNVVSDVNNTILQYLKDKSR
ncbi:MAG: hypothetical protein GXZ11_05720 [Tissierellia bacterium]|nr:hypothetical protein [Tissierellia bacterium]